MRIQYTTDIDFGSFVSSYFKEPNKPLPFRVRITVKRNDFRSEKGFNALTEGEIYEVTGSNLIKLIKQLNSITLGHINGN